MHKQPCVHRIDALQATTRVWSVSNTVVALHSEERERETLHVSPVEFTLAENLRTF